MPEAFAYTRPTTLDEALGALRGDGALPLAGATDVVTMRAAGAIAPATMVDVKGVPELRGLRADPGVVRIGATATLRELEPVADQALAAVIDGARIVGAPQTRARATLGGNLCRSSPAGDTLCGLLVLDAVAELRSAERARTVAVRDFFTGPGRNVRAPDELLVAVRIPRAEGGSAYRRYTYRRSMDLAVVGTAARVVIRDGVCAEAAVAIGAAAPSPILVPAAAQALLGAPWGPAAIELACDAVVEAAAPIDDVRGTRRHRLRALRAVTRAVLATAAARAESAGVRAGVGTTGTEEP